MRAPRILLLIVALVVAGCTAEPTAGQQPSSSVGPFSPADTTTTPTTTPSSARPTPLSSPTARPTATPTPRPTTTPTPRPTTRPTPTPEGPADPRWQFSTDDQTAYRSAWFDGYHRLMIGYGCTEAPFYVPDDRCPGRQGYHHGLDVAMPCGTTLRAGVAAVVIDPTRPGRPGPTGSTAFRLRVSTDDGRFDIVIGHATTVLVEPGERVRPGQSIARAGDRGVTDGCHLHFEQRGADGEVSSASDPARLLALRR